MSEKVKLKRKHADLIESELGKMSKSDLMNQHVRTIVEKNNRFVGDYAPFNSLSIEDMAKALYIGYEVEEEWQTGDWVVTKSGYIGEIEFINEIEGWANIGYSKDTLKRGVCLAKTFNLDEIKRHATEQEIAQEKERRFFARHGRKLWELRKGDLLYEKGASFTVSNPGEIAVRFEESKLLFDWDKITKNFKVSCFVEDRLDQ